MHVEGMLDIEAELLRRVRKVIGNEVVVSASMDLHGNVSRELAHQLDLVTCYRMAPHEDEGETKERACVNLVDVLKRKHRFEVITSTNNDDDNEHRNSISESDSKRRRLYLPLKAYIPLPILLPGEQTSTRDEPARTIYGAIPTTIDSHHSILDASIWVGYAWGDEYRNRAIVMVTGWNEVAVRSGAEKLAKLFWDSRREFHFVAPTGTLDECLDAAFKATKEGRERPFYISDSGDNPTAGGSGDVTWSLNQILRRKEFYHTTSRPGPVLIYASIPAPSAITTAFSSGVGAHITLVSCGAGIDNLHCGPLSLTGVVHSLHTGDRHALREAVLQISDSNIFVILTERRKPYHKEIDFMNLGLDPRNGADIVVVKIGYLEPELHEMQKGWMLALTPGGVDQELKRLGHERIRRPMWPFDGDEEFEEAMGKEVDLRARIIPGSWEELGREDD